MADTDILMAVIGSAHGIRGEVRAKVFAADSVALGRYGPLHARDGRIFTVKSMRPGKGAMVVSFAEIADRNAAEALAGVELYVARERLPDDLEEDEYYHADLAGLEAHGAGGRVIGRVKALHDFGAGDILEIALEEGGSVMVPFTRAAVLEIDLAAGFVVLDEVAAGLEGGE